MTILLSSKSLMTHQNPIATTTPATPLSERKTQFFNDYDGGIFSDALTDTNYYKRKNTEAVQEKQLKWLSESTNEDRGVKTQATDDGAQNAVDLGPILKTFIRYFISGRARKRRNVDYSFVDQNRVDGYDSDRYEDYEEEPPHHFHPIPVF